VYALQKRYGSRLYLERRNVGAVVTRDRSGAATGMFHASKVVGAADYFGILRDTEISDARHFEIEFKAAKGKQREGQRRFQARMETLGVPYLLWKFSPAASLEVNVERCLILFADALDLDH